MTACSESVTSSIPFSPSPTVLMRTNDCRLQYSQCEDEMKNISTTECQKLDTIFVCRYHIHQVRSFNTEICAQQLLPSHTVAIFHTTTQNTPTSNYHFLLMTPQDSSVLGQHRHQLLQPALTIQTSVLTYGAIRMQTTYLLTLMSPSPMSLGVRLRLHLQP